MTIILNHTIVAVGDKHRGARFLADLLRLEAGPLALQVGARVGLLDDALQEVHLQIQRLTAGPAAAVSPGPRRPFLRA